MLEARRARANSPAPLLGRPALDVALDFGKAGGYLAVISWAWLEPAGLGPFVFGGFVLADLTTWVLLSIGEMFVRPFSFAVETAGFAAFLLLLGRIGAFEIPVGQEGEALAVGFLSYLATFWTKFTLHSLRKIAGSLEET
jgi:hypothetical protein